MGGQNLNRKSEDRCLVFFFSFPISTNFFFHHLQGTSSDTIKCSSGTCQCVAKYSFIYSNVRIFSTLCIFLSRNKIVFELSQVHGSKAPGNGGATADDESTKAYGYEWAIPYSSVTIWFANIYAKS